MLMHEWLRYRERAATRRSLPDQPASEPEKPEAPEDSATEPETTATEPAPDTTEIEPERTPPAQVKPPAPRAASGRVPTVPSDLNPPEVQSRRLQLLLGRQQRLPLEVEETEPPTRGSAARESREELIERLLDPVLSIEETATLLGVCATSVRRYTNRGLLKCFRTPGNQRRFRLSDVLDFMEKQQSSASE